MQRVPTYRPSLEEALGGKPTKAEAKILAAAKAGDWAELSPIGVRPEEPSAATRIRAPLIRFLMLGGDEVHPIHPRGVMVKGAWIKGELDFQACETQLDLKLAACFFDSVPNFNDAHLGGLYLPGCHLPGLRGQRMRLEESLHLRALPRDNAPPLPFEAVGLLDIAGARIDGQLDCDGGRFDGAGGRAFNGDAMTVGADVFLRYGFHAKGEVNLIRAAISGMLSCIGAQFEGSKSPALNGDSLTVGANVFLKDGFRAIGEVRLVRAVITGQLACVGGFFDHIGKQSLNCDAMMVGADVFLRDGFHSTGQVNLRRARIAAMLDLKSARFDGGVDLTEAEAGVLSDSAASWQQATSVKLSGFRFRSVQSRMTVEDRVQLLNRSHQHSLSVTSTGKRHFPDEPTDFDPRAYGELARAYLRQGERKAAALVLEAREDRSRDAELRRAKAEELPGFRLDVTLARLRWAAMWLFKVLFGYGHRPARVFVTLIPLWVGLAVFFGHIYDKGQFAPNSDVILTSTEWQDAVKAGCPLPADEMYPAKVAEGCEMPLTLWAGDFDRNLPPADAAKDYETFGRWLYAADLFLPLDTIGQTKSWAPSKDRGTWGWWGYYLRFPVQLFGWIIVAMSAAILTGLIGRRED